MKKYTCEKCGWIEEQLDTYPQNVFQGAIEAHTNHFCKNKEKLYKQKLIDLLKSDNEVKEAMEELKMGFMYKFHDGKIRYLTKQQENCKVEGELGLGGYFSFSSYPILEIIGLPLQERFLRMYCKRKGIENVRIKWDGEIIQENKHIARLDETKDLDNQSEEVYQKIYEALLEINK